MSLYHIERVVLQCYDRAPSQRSTPLHTEAAGAAPFDTFGPFRVLHQIGAGTLGPVFRAYDPDQDRLVAVKLFQLDLSPERVHQLVGGLQRLIDADLAHPALSAPIAAGIVGASAYLAQDFVAADSLDVVIREFGPMALGEAARVASQLAGALDFAATAGVCHGALHPRDVLLASDDARLTGLGVTQVLDRIGISSGMRRPYTAPERLSGQPWDRRADVFSLGALVAEMITGRRLTGTGAKAVDGIPDAPGDDPGALRQVFSKALADRPDERFHTAQAFADAIKTIADRAGVAKGPDAVSLAPPLDRLLEPRLPLDEPTGRVAEMPLPGDVPLERDVEAVWEVALASNAPLAPSVEPSFAREPAAPNPPSTARLLPDKAAWSAPSPTARMDSGRDATHSAVWPLALALTVGLIVGVAVGFFIFAERAPTHVETATAAGQGSTEPRPVSPMAGAEPVPRPAGPVASATPSAADATPATAAPGPPPSATAPSVPASSAPADAVVSAPAAPRLSPSPVAPAAQDAARTAERRRPAPPEPRRAGAAGGRLLVRTSPAGARVLLDGQEAGTTPLTLRSLPFGTHMLRMTREGYESESRRVIISTAQPAQSLIVDLTRSDLSRARGGTASAGAPQSPFIATLFVESRPPGASVYLDGRRVGTTPLVLDAAPTGSHALRLELDGYRRWTSSVRVAAGERNRVTASLEQ